MYEKKDGLFAMREADDLGVAVELMRSTAKANGREREEVSMDDDGEDKTKRMWMNGRSWIRGMEDGVGVDLRPFQSITGQGITGRP